jgi:diguanylate cyclase (GGDEF)-like protein
VTAFDRSVDGRRTSSARVLAALTELGSLPARLATSDFVVVGESARFRAVQRRRTRSATRVGLAVVAAAVAFDAVTLLGFGGPAVRVAIALDVVVVMIALVSLWLLPKSLRHVPELVAWVVTIGLTASTLGTGLAVPDLTVQTVGYLLLLPGLIALVLPWRTRVHLRWLLAFTMLSVGYFAFGLGTRFTLDERADLVTVLVVALGASLAGHLLLQRAQIRSFAQLQKITALRRRSDADMVELERVHHALELTARIDPLTGAGNRRRLDEDLRAVRAHIDRSLMRYGLLEIDLDHFKAINDSMGHLAGDDVLRQVVEALQGTLRGTDAIYRFGGEEFVVIMPVPNEEGLIAAAERLRSSVEGLGIAHPANPGVDVVTVSIGATLMGATELTLTDAGWFALTDRALYAAKAGGRNRVRYLAPEAPES